MSITITCEFRHPYEARQAAERLRRRGYIVSTRTSEHSDSMPSDSLLVAYPYGQVGGNSSGNHLMGAMPAMAGNGILLHTRNSQSPTLVSVLTDDTCANDAKLLLQGLGGHII